MTNSYGGRNLELATDLPWQVTWQLTVLLLTKDPGSRQRSNQPRMRLPSELKMPLKFISSACGLLALARASTLETFPS